MSDSDQHPISDREEKKPFQFSIAFLLWLTAACAFVLGIATWTPYLSVLAAAIPAIITWAYRRGRRAFRFSIVFGAAMTGVTYGDWRMHVTGLPRGAGEPGESVFVFLLLAILGLLAGLAIEAAVDKYERTNPPQRTERQPPLVSQDE